LRYNGETVDDPSTMDADSRADLFAAIKENLLLLVAVGVYWVLAVLTPRDLFGEPGGAVYYVQNLAWLAFVLIHGSKRYGWDSLFVFFGITFLISWLLESISIATGFPFGEYYYTDLLGPKIGTVPMAVMPAYFVAGYLAWTMSGIFLGNLGKGIQRRNLVLVPVVAGFLLVMWDYCLDPIRSTIEGVWIWRADGAHHGVPISNYFGWYLTSFLIFQTYAIYLLRFRKNETVKQSPMYWCLAPIMYLGLALRHLLGPFFHTANLDIYWSQFLSCIFTMVFASTLNIIFVSRMKEPGT
jgi:putative membrane protein